jgi:hypothetical protein
MNCQGLNINTNKVHQMRSLGNFKVNPGSMMILFTLENGTPALNKISAYQSWAWCFQGLGCGLGIQENHSHPQT